MTSEINTVRIANASDGADGPASPIAAARAELYHALAANQDDDRGQRR